jgi:hypothetical protein
MGTTKAKSFIGDKYGNIRGGITKREQTQTDVLKSSAIGGQSEKHSQRAKGEVEGGLYNALRTVVLSKGYISTAIVGSRSYYHS